MDKRTDELRDLIRKNINEDLEFNNKMKSLSNTYRDYKLNTHEIFQLISNKVDENSKELVELWFLETTKNFAHVKDVLKSLDSVGRFNT